VKTALLDTNVVLDVLLDRPPHSTASAAVWTAIETGRAKGLVAAHAVTTIHYLIAKELGTTKAKRMTKAIVTVFGVAAVDQAVIHQALTLPSADFEDAVTQAAAAVAGCDFIVTRDVKGFRKSPVRPLLPEAFLPLLIPTNGSDAI
jgi:predicted nucleic acid-binding protein